MPNRIIREGILTSKRIATLVEHGGWEAEVFYRRLLSVVDDYGRFEADSVLLRSRLYPRHLDRVATSHIQRCLASTQAARLVGVYESEGEEYLCVLDFNQQTRAKRSKYPPPPSDAQHVHSTCAQMRASAHLDGDVYGDGDGDGRDKSRGFDFWWEVYPRKVGKQAAKRAWAKAKRPDVATLTAAVERQKASEQWRKGFIPNPATWLNQGRWDDELPPPPNDSGCLTPNATFDSDPDDPDLLDMIWGGDA